MVDFTKMTRSQPIDYNATEYKIFHDLYPVRMKYIDTFSIEDINRFGYPTTGDKKEDEQNLNTIVLCQIPITKMIHHYFEETPFVIDSSVNIEEMVELLADHLAKWRNYAQYSSITMRDIPFEDLILMGTFATALFDVRDITRDREGDRFESMFKHTGYITVDDLFGGPSVQRTPNVTKPPPHLDDLVALKEIYKRVKQKWQV